MDKVQKKKKSSKKDNEADSYWETKKKLEGEEKKAFHAGGFPGTGVRLAGYVLLSARPMCLTKTSQAGANIAGFARVVNAMLDQGPA